MYLLGRAHRLFDVAGTLGLSGMLLIMVISAIRNTMRLYRQEPLPVGKPQSSAKTFPLDQKRPPQRLLRVPL